MENSALTQFCKAIGLDPDFIPPLLGAVRRLGAPLTEAVDRYLADRTLAANAVTETLAPLAEGAGIHAYTRDAAFTLLASYRQKEDFIAEYGEEIFWGAACDLVWKMRECHRRFGIVGTCSIAWHHKLLRQEYFSLGRLQFHLDPIHCDIDVGGIRLKKGDTVVRIHIPSSGKLTEELCLDAYRRAYRHFRRHFESDVIPFYCCTWMLDPYVPAAVPGGGLSAFAAPFTLFDVKDDPSNLNFWRIFGKEYKDPAEMPRESRLQIAIADRYAAGECMKIGYGVFLFDGEKVVG